MFEFIIDKGKALVNRGRFFAAHCSASISAYDPLTFFFGTEYATHGGVSTVLNMIPWLGGRTAGYFTLAYYFRSLYHNIQENIKRHPDSIDLKAKRVELCRNSKTILYSLRQHKDTTREYLHQKSSLSNLEIEWLLDIDAERLDDFSLIRFYTQFREIHHIKHPFEPDPLNSLKSGIAHGYPHLIVGMLFKAFAGIDLTDNTLSPEKVIVYLLMLMGLYSVYQTYQFNLQEKPPTSYDLMTCFAKETSFFSVTAETKESTPLLSHKPESKHTYAINIDSDIDALVYQEALIDAFAPCCLKAHGF